MCTSDATGRVWDVYLTRGRPGAQGAGGGGGPLQYGVQVLGRAGETPLEPKRLVVKVGGRSRARLGACVPWRVRALACACLCARTRTGSGVRIWKALLMGFEQKS